MRRFSWGLFDAVDALALFFLSTTDYTASHWPRFRALLDLLPHGLLQPKVVEFLLHMFGRPRGPADVWVDISDVNVFMQKWAAERFHVADREADKMLSGRWNLPQRRRHVPTAALAGDAPNVEYVVPVRPSKTMAYRYLHRAVSHFYQRIGNKAVSAFSTFVNDQAGLGTLQRTRGTRTKFEVVFAPEEAADLLLSDAFITELVYRSAVVRALHVVFSLLGVLHLFSEAGGAVGSADVIACLTAHFALVSMKIRACLKKRAAASESDDEDAIDTTPGLNGGHRAEWVEELATVRHLLASQGGRTCNGLRLTDGEQPRRDDPSYRELSAPTPAAGNTPPAPTAPPIIDDAMHTTGAVVNGSVDGRANGEESLHADSVGPEQAAVAAAHAAVAHAMAGTYEEVE